MTRTPYDGKPFYCDTCGAGYGEYMGCEEVDCRIESREKSEARAVEHKQKICEQKEKKS